MHRSIATVSLGGTLPENVRLHTRLPTWPLAGGADDTLVG